MTTTDVNHPIGLGGNMIAPPPTSKAARAAWLRARKSGLGASDVAAVLGLSKWSTPLDVWLDKTDPERFDDAGEAASWGLRLERAIVDEFRVRHARQFGLRVASCPGLLRHPVHEWLLATPDRIGVDLVTRKPVCVIEIKTAGHYQREEWRDPDTREPVVPLAYEIQTQIQMAVTGLQFALVVPLLGGQRMPEPIRVERDDDVIGQAIEICGAFWRDHVLKRVPPPARVEDLPHLSEVYPGEPAKVVDLTEDLANLLHWRALLDEEIKDRKREVAEIDVEVKEAMGDAQYAVDEEGQRLASWTRFGRRTTNWDALYEAHPEVKDLVAEFTTREPSERFTVKAAPAQRPTTIEE